MTIKIISSFLFSLFFLSLFYSQVGIGNANPRGALDINLDSGNNTMGLVLPSNTSAQNIINPLGGTVATGTLMYDLSEDCVKVHRSTGWSGCLSEQPQQAALSIDCSGSLSGTFTASAFSTGSKIINYTDGNGAQYPAISISSTGITGLTASAPAGTLSDGSGSITLSIKGVPNGTGFANFNIQIGGKSCSFVVNITQTANWNAICTNLEYGFNISTHPGKPTTISLPSGKTVNVYAIVTQGSLSSVSDPYAAFAFSATQSTIQMNRNYYRIGTYGDLGTGAYSKVVLVFSKPINFVGIKSTWYAYVSNTLRDSQLVSTNTGGTLKMVGLQGSPSNLAEVTSGSKLLSRAQLYGTDASGTAYILSAQNYFTELTLTTETNYNDILSALTFCNADVMD
ncbi:MAG: hypothetical protein ACN6OB_22400 [Chryseobacterium jejuense]|uniref:hypothetical protein n=1 Tax=Chryseobacterium jejuense TaxID=445960 RepID=UPI003D0C4246